MARPKASYTRRRATTPRPRMTQPGNPFSANRRTRRRGARAGTEARPDRGAKVNSILGSSHLPRKNSGKKLKQEDAPRRFSLSQNHTPGPPDPGDGTQQEGRHGGHNPRHAPPCLDRKSTRLKSSHLGISYA